MSCMSKVWLKKNVFNGHMFGIDDMNSYDGKN